MDVKNFLRTEGLKKDNIVVHPFEIPRHRSVSMKKEKYVILLQRVKVYVTIRGHELLFDIFEGNRFDGASNPRIGWTFAGITPWSPGGWWGGLVHDNIYVRAGGTKRVLAPMHVYFDGELYGETGVEEIISRQLIDMIMASGFELWYTEFQSWRAYRWVRMFGGKHWGGPVPGFKGVEHLCHTCKRYCEFPDCMPEDNSGGITHQSNGRYLDCISKCSNCVKKKR